MKILAQTLSALCIATLLCVIPVSRAAAPQHAPISQRRLAELNHGPWLTVDGGVSPALLRELEKRVGQISCPEGGDIPKFYAKSVSLSKTGPESLTIVQGPSCYCSATGNCPLWVFRKTAHGYKELGAADSVQTFSVARIKTKGLPDIVLSRTESFDWSRLFLARFDGKKYRFVGCYNARYGYIDRAGVRRERKKPKITPCDR